MKKFMPIFRIRALFFSFAIVTLLIPAIAYSSDMQSHPGHQTFTIAVIPDTQNYVDNNKPQPSSLITFKEETEYLAAHKRDLNLVFVTHVGDVVQHGDGTDGANPIYGGTAEYDRAYEAMDILALSGIPFGMAPGNHDYDNYSYAHGNRPLSGSSMWQTYFGSSSPFFSGKSWYGGASNNLAYNPGMSSYQIFTVYGKDFLHIALELEAGDEALAWAQSVIDSHPGYATIVTTHSFLNPPATNDTNKPLEVLAVRTTADYLKNSPGGWNDATGVWKDFIAVNEQIFLVICGHAWNPAVNGVSTSENLRIGMNDAGQTVYQVLTDYQGNTLSTSGGDGWLRFMEFDLNDQTIDFYTYSPTLYQYAGKYGQATFNQPAEFSNFTLPMPEQVVNATHGQHGKRHQCKVPR